MPKAIPRLQNLEGFTTKLLQELDAAGLGDIFTQVDHACYRVSSLSGYEELKRELKSHTKLLSEAYINGRPIASYKLNHPIKVSGKYLVDVLELPAPKPNASYEDGFEHIEVVTKTRLEDLITTYPQFTFNTHNLGAEINRDISLRLPSGLVKFHESSLEAVIAEEQAVLAKRSKHPLVLLDFDETIVSSKKPFLKAAHLVLEGELKRKIAFEEIIQKARPTFPEFFANFGLKLDRDMVARMLAAFPAAWEQFFSECTVPVGVESMLSCLKSEGFVVHVWTARDGATTLSTLERFGLRAYIEAVHAFDGTAHGKPEPDDVLLRAAKNASHVIMVGDSHSDAAGAAAVGATFIQAAWVHTAKLTTPEKMIARSPLEALSHMLECIRLSPT